MPTNAETDKKLQEGLGFSGPVEKTPLQKSGDPLEDSEVESAIGGRVSTFKLTDEGVLESNAQLPEDEFKGFYQSLNAIAPPFNFHVLENLQYLNNTLAQCITAMEVNIDGSGFIIEALDQDEPLDKKQAKIAKEFFAEVFPGQSFLTMRRRLRRDLESTGNGYFEVIRNLEGKLIFLRRVDPKSVRLIKLGAPVPVKVKLRRGGVSIEVTIMLRERIFVQMFGIGVDAKFYFKQFKASRELDKHTGLWEDDPAVGGAIPVERRATEIIHFTMNPDVNTEYGLPRWINQIPSILGSREAEEYNVDFFRAGGMPPAMIMIEGGTMASDVRRQLQSYLSGKGREKHRWAIVELFSTGGSMEKAGQVKVKVERFGAERQNDSMFENYDKRSEERVRGSFRIPPIFVGKASDYSFATAFASYILGETQVFSPERQEFDEVVNRLIMPELGLDKVKYRSLPISINETKIQIEALKVARAGNSISGEGLIKALNEITGLNLTFEQQIQDPPVRNGEGQTGPQPGVNPTPVQGTRATGRLENNRKEQTKVQKGRLDPIEVVGLAQDYVAYMTSSLNKSDEELGTLLSRIKALCVEDRQLFDRVVFAKAIKGAGSETCAAGLEEIITPMIDAELQNNGG